MTGIKIRAILSSIRIKTKTNLFPALHASFMYLEILIGSLEMPVSFVIKVTT